MNYLFHPLANVALPHTTEVRKLFYTGWEPDSQESASLGYLRV